MDDKWADWLHGNSYDVVDLGRPANFLVPSHKWKISLGDLTVEESLHAFLFEQFGAFTTTMFPTAGLWRSGGSEVVYDECRQYEVSFCGKERIPKLLEKLGEIAAQISEDCIYFKAGQYTCLVYPKKAGA